LAISSANLSAPGTTTREDFVLKINAGNGNDVISTAIVNDAGERDTLAALQTAATDATPWYNNSKLNANLSIDAGTGNDTIHTLGSGDWKVTLGTGNDTYYADNTGRDVTVGTAGAETSTGRATWVFNTRDQVNDAGVSSGGTTRTDARVLDNLRSDGNEKYTIYNDTETTNGSGLRLRVVFKDVSESTNTPDPSATNSTGSGVFISHIVDVPLIKANGRDFDDLAINQAIKKAINDDPVLSKLLLATDGPANTLVVTSLSDGLHLENDLEIDFSAWTKGSDYNSTLQKLLGYTSTPTASTSTYDSYGEDAGATTDWTGWYISNASAAAGDADYLANFASNSVAPSSVYGEITGANSNHASDNTIYVKSGSGDHDVVVLSTGGLSNDTLVWEGLNNGKVTVVNFDANDTDTLATPTANLGQDWLDFTAYNVKGVYVGELNATTKFNSSWLEVNDRGDATKPSLSWGSLSATTNDQYITLTRVTSTNEKSTEYRIDLWTVVGTGADAYASATSDDRPELIGYVDLGRDITGTNTDVHNLLAQIDW
jgi:hypothetical protein